MKYFLSTLALLLIFFSISKSEIKPAKNTVSAIELERKTPKVSVNLDNIIMIVCYDENIKMWNTGTGFYINKETLITAHHVVENKTCYDLSKTELTIVHEDSNNDFAMLNTTKHRSSYISQYSCDGFLPNNTYYAIGFADSTNFALNILVATSIKTKEDLIISGKPSAGLRALRGSIVSGMSGGPIYDINGKVVGINSATNGDDLALSRELRDTILCRKPSN